VTTARAPARDLSTGVVRRSFTSPTAALVRRAFLDARTRTLTFAYIYAVYSWVQTAAYHTTYPTVADRTAFARSFAGNDAIRLFYGYPYDVTTVGGYSAWRVGGTLSLAAAAFGTLAAVRALRTEEDVGRTELVLAGIVSRNMVFLSAMTAVAAGATVLWLAEFAGFVIAGLPVAGSAYLALATCSVVLVFVAIGALASQLAASRRIALGLGAGAVSLFWLLRVLSDTISAMGWLRWMTPLGWAEALRPFGGPRPVFLLLAVGAGVPLLIVAARISASRDVGAGLVPATDTAQPSSRLLSSPTAQAFRRQRGILAGWTVGIASFGVILGAISTSVSTAGISQEMEKEFEKFGTGSIVSPAGYLSFVFVVFIFAMCLFVCSQVGAARDEESDQRLETLLAQPVSRYRWLGGRLALSAVATGALSLLSGVMTWVGAHSQAVHVSLPRLLEASANCVPTSIMFLGIAALIYSVLPRASSALSYSLVGVSFLWYMVGALAGAPGWLVDLTPFRHIGLVPVQSFQLWAAVVMVAIGLGAASASLSFFGRRDLLGS
jgi:ABC-2 type transport system permease protein